MKTIQQEDVIQASTKLHTRVLSDYQLETIKILFHYKQKINDRIKTHKRTFNFGDL